MNQILDAQAAWRRLAYYRRFLRVTIRLTATKSVLSIVIPGWIEFSKLPNSHTSKFHFCTWFARESRQYSSIAFSQRMNPDPRPNELTVFGCLADQFKNS